MFFSKITCRNAPQKLSGCIVQCPQTMRQMIWKCTHYTGTNAIELCSHIHTPVSTDPKSTVPISNIQNICTHLGAMYIVYNLYTDSHNVSVKEILFQVKLISYFILSLAKVKYQTHRNAHPPTHAHPHT